MLGETLDKIELIWQVPWGYVPDLNDQKNLEAFNDVLCIEADESKEDH